MKLNIFLSFFCLLLCLSYSSHAATVTGVRVSVTAESAAAAREQAIKEAHLKAYEKLMQERNKQGQTPSLDTIMDMVKDFSVDKEKSTPTSYTASFTFEFNESALNSSLNGSNNVAEEQDQSSSSEDVSTAATLFPTLLVSYQDQAEWLHIKDMLRSTPHLQKLVVLSLSLEEALLRFNYNGSQQQFAQAMEKQGYNVTFPVSGPWQLKKNDSMQPLLAREQL